MTVRTAIALLGVALVCAAASVASALHSARLWVQANEFWMSVTSSQLDPGEVLATDEQYRYANSLYMSSSAMSDLTAPLLIAALVALLTAIAVLGAGWDAEHRPAERANQAEATAAS
jgi:hypothetical protein